MMLRPIPAEDAASLVARGLARAVEYRAEFIHFELKQHYLLVRIRWESRVRMVWRGGHVEGLKVMEYLKAAAGMDAFLRHAVQSGEFAFIHGGRSVLLPAVCKPYLSEEKVVIALLPLWDVVAG